MNDAGIMIDKWWNELKHKYRNVELHEQIIMPNHFHGIIQIINDADSVGADLRVCPDNTWQTSKTGQSHRIAPTGTKKSGERALGEHIGSPLHTTVSFRQVTIALWHGNHQWRRFRRGRPACLP